MWGFSFGSLKLVYSLTLGNFNFAKINRAAMTQNWEMEVDWVKHEYWQAPR